MAAITGFHALDGLFEGYFSAGVPAAGTNAVQTLTVTATGGTYVLSYEGARTTALAFGAAAATIQAALIALPTIGAAGVALTGTGPWMITFGGNLALRPVSVIGVDNSAATGGTAAIANTTPGVAAHGRGAPKGARTIDTTNGKIYVQAGTPLAPDWRLVTSA